MYILITILPDLLAATGVTWRKNNCS